MILERGVALRHLPATRLEPPAHRRGLEVVGQAHEHRGAGLRPCGRAEAEGRGAGGAVLAMRLAYADDRRLDEGRARSVLRGPVLRVRWGWGQGQGQG